MDNRHFLARKVLSDVGYYRALDIMMRRLKKAQ